MQNLLSCPGVQGPSPSLLCPLARPQARPPEWQEGGDKSKMDNISLPATWARRVPRVEEVQNTGEADAHRSASGATLTAGFHGGNGLGASPAGVTDQVT